MTKTEKWNSYIKLIRIDESYGKGLVYLAEPFKGIGVLLNDFREHGFNEEEGSFEDRKNIHINYCIDGRVEVQLDGERFMYIDTGNICIDAQKPDKSRVYISGKFYGIEVQFDLKALEKILLSFYGIKAEHIMSVLNSGSSVVGEVTRSYIDIIHKIEKCMLNKESCIEELRYLTLRFLRELSYSVEKFSSPKMFLTKGQSRIAKEVESSISSDLSNNKSIDDLAKSYGVSASSLKKYFYMVYGEPISIYKRNLRIKEAKRLLEMTDCSVLNISNAVGYTNQSKFGAVFKKLVGVTPIEYRRRKNI